MTRSPVQLRLRAQIFCSSSVLSAVNWFGSTVNTFFVFARTGSIWCCFRSWKVEGSQHDLAGSQHVVTSCIDMGRRIDLKLALEDLSLIAEWTDRKDHSVTTKQCYYYCKTYSSCPSGDPSDASDNDRQRPAPNAARHGEVRA
jgi:hypothetical protein